MAPSRENQKRELTVLCLARCVSVLLAVSVPWCICCLRLVSTPFEELLNEHAQENPFSGVDVEQVVEMIVTPFCQDLCTEIDKLYSVNQKMIKLAATCRKETHKQEQKNQDLEARLLRMKRQAKQDSVDLTRLQAGMQLRDTQLKHIRDAYEKEVISVKIQAANAVTTATTASDIKNKESKSYEPGLLPDKIGLDASGQDLDGFVQSYTAQLREKLAMIPQEPPGGVQFAKGGRKIENETFDLQVLCMCALISVARLCVCSSLGSTPQRNNQSKVWADQVTYALLHGRDC